MTDRDIKGGGRLGLSPGCSGWETGGSITAAVSGSGCCIAAVWLFKISSAVSASNSQSKASCGCALFEVIRDAEASNSCSRNC